jgi:hypothetical protein
MSPFRGVARLIQVFAKPSIPLPHFRVKLAALHSQEILRWKSLHEDIPHQSIYAANLLKKGSWFSLQILKDFLYFSSSTAR